VYSKPLFSGIYEEWGVLVTLMKEKQGFETTHFHFSSYVEAVLDDVTV
jgi:hypothetical protein